MNSILLALTSGIFFPLALPNELLMFGSPVLGIVALSPLYAAFALAGERRLAVYAGIVFGAVSTAVGNFWLANFGDFSVWTLGAPIAGYIAYNWLLAIALYNLKHLHPHLRPLMFAAVWTGYEFLKSVGYLGYPWGLAAYPFANVAFMTQIADITGVYGLTFLAVYVQSVVAELALCFSRRHESAYHLRPAVVRTFRQLTAHGALILLLTTATALYGIVRLSDARVSGRRIRVALVQQNSDSWAFGNEEETLETLIRLSRTALADASPDLLIWSETSLRLPYENYADTWYERVPSGTSFRDFLRDSPVPLLTGSPYLPADRDGVAWNAALMLQPDGAISDVYGKRQLVPFAESVPFWEWGLVRRFYRDVIGIQAVWEPGDRVTVFEVPTNTGPVYASAPICFEDAFAGVVRDFHRAGAEVLLNLTNNAWSRTDSAQTQHFTAARFRSIETRLPLVRSTNAGLTPIVDRHGRLQTSLPMFEEGVLVADVDILTDQRLTVYSTVGDVFALSMLMIGLFGIVIIRVPATPNTLF
ncbi:MAG: apolipoprotein N-acyltransferase [Spirochaetota bacterium]